MHDQPDPPAILAAAADQLRREILPALPADLAFKVRVLANALDLAARQAAQGGAPAEEEHRRLIALLGEEGSNSALNAELARRIEAGSIALTDPVLLDHLWTTTLGKIAVDQPNYASYRAEIAVGGR